MIVIPEILDHIAIYVDADSAIACVPVCRQWRDLFTPYLWRTVDTGASPHCQIFACGGNQRQRHRWISALFQKYKRHIRNLTITNHGELLASLENDLTELHSLTLKRSIVNRVPFVDAYDDERSVDESYRDDNGFYSSVLHTRPWELAIPREAFDQGYSGEAALTRGSWLLVQNNLNLRRIAFDSTWGALSFKNTPSFFGYPSLMQSEGVSFLTGILSILPSLQHLEIGSHADDYLFANLATILPNLESFVYSSPTCFMPWEILILPHRALKRLVFKKRISTEQLRAIAVALPSLIQLSFPELHNREGFTNMTGNNRRDGPVMADALECKLLESLDITARRCDLNGVLGALIRFPRIKQLDKGVNNLHLSIRFQQVLWSFPSLLRLECSAKSMQKIIFTNYGVFEHPVQELVLRNIGFVANQIQSMFLRLPFLVDLEVHIYEFNGETLLELARTYRMLERLQIDLQDDCSWAMVDFLNTCPPTLKTFRGNGHIALVADVLERAEWSSCTGLEELDIEIFGIFRLTNEQEALLDNLWKLDPSWFEATMNAEAAMADEEAAETGAVEQALKRVVQLGHTMTAAEATALQHRQMMYWTQREIYKRLGQLTQLREIDFFPGEFWEPDGYPWMGHPCTLEHTLLSGISELAGLVHLEAIRFNGPDFGAGEADLEWMMKQWSMTKSVVNGRTHLIKA
ncbi:hypothetical protein BGZ95_003537 [Linnemannia exigua]|uniref:F-box domain-containing protein n=1 Tax=Linnemannia exigua TaxID=604196 RepID=A0AAD4H9A5_9FUNG|nr:hypothetical protein BGZ95_003537 [Linnemannia exigua]